MFAGRALLPLVMLALVLPFAAGPASASPQEFRGSIRGTVTDTSGAVLPGVTVTVTNTETKIAQTAVSDSEGRYQVLYLNPGTYSIAAELMGFSKYLLPSTRVGVGDAAKVDVVLQTGGVQETVEVVAVRSCGCRSEGARPSARTGTRRSMPSLAAGS